MSSNYARAASYGIALALLTGCAAYDRGSLTLAHAITPYQITIEQGNFVSRESVAQLRPGMTRDQVSFLLGTPLLTDVFHADRWDYVFTFRRGHRDIVQQRRLTAYFAGDRLLRFDSDPMPSEEELIAEIDGVRHGKVSPSAKASSPADTAKPQPLGPTA
ncbi:MULTISPECIES: outer membrane protein assembly factor BamE [Cupriavidus]|jgi:outer membrane protein assembly factor BamE|uniref:Outer membrane protein assembly factor BamE n=1 Tax=Cupriavidus metallidurans TaxID=119219 RepID=A0A482INX9_9BURK|nr:outer membrane protein assembly factor BamE [Cupriavidus metallidurans]KWR78480.1 hypothetical protein RN01_23745 [Cupriavidus sp. SHE]QBP09646.1 outer membrane protein assembly factor BamE [Cupriavidus metallidurans]QWC89997.1 outer membrane protein assembly factor BamE [Cupriavidus metallidurans]